MINGSGNDDWDDDIDWEKEDYETDSDICPYCGLPMIDDVEVGQGYHSTAPCWMIGSGDHEALQKWFEDKWLSMTSMIRIWLQG